MLQGIPSGSYSLIYLDPARRNKGGGRVYSLKDCEPDITVLRQELLRIAPRILLKASPMADISVLLSQLPEAAEVHILSSDNECKEVLILMLRGNALPAEEIPIVAAELQSGDNSGEGTEEFHFTLREEREAATDMAAPSEINGFLFEPSPALLKGGAFKLPAVRFGLRKISASTHFYTAPAPVEHFPGKIRRILEVLPFHKAAIRDSGKIPRLLRHSPQLPDDIRRAPPSSRHLRERYLPRPGHHRLRQLPGSHCLSRNATRQPKNFLLKLTR